MSSTGPFLLIDSYNAYQDKSNLKIVEPELIYPIHLGESKLILSNTISKELAQRINNAYAIHYFSGTWW